MKIRARKPLSCLLALAMIFSLFAAMPFTASAAPGTPVTFTAMQTGGAAGTANSTGITLTFTPAVTGLTAADITIINGTGAVTSGALNSSGTTWTLALSSVQTGGYVTVSVADFGGFEVTTTPQTVAVYKNTPAPPTTYAVTVTGGGTGASGNGSYAVGAPVTIDAGTRSGYTFSNWTVNPSSVSLANNASATTTFFMPNSDVNVTANWTANGPTYPVTVNNSGAVTTGAGNYAAGALVTIDAGGRGSINGRYTFSNWTIDSGGIMLANASSATTTFTMPNNPVTVSAVWLYNADLVGGGGGGGGGSSGASLSPSSATFDKNTASADYKDIAVTLNKKTYSLTAITNGNYTLKEGTDYTVAGNVYTIKKEYLVTLANGSAALTFDMSGGSDPKLTVTVKNTSDNPFRDIEDGAWYSAAAADMYDRGLMIGTDEDSFEPNGTLTRAMFLTIIYRLAGEPSVDGLSNPFTDVPDDIWYTDAVTWGAENDIVLGYGDGRFGPNDPVTKEQLAVLVYRTEQANQQIPPNVPGEHKAFTDANSVSPWAQPAVNALNDQGIFGDLPGTSFGPQSPAIRAEIASMLYIYLTAIE